MRILYIHQYFSTPKGSGGSRSFFFAKELIKAGHEVKMLCLNDSRSNTGLTGPFKKGKRKGIVEGIEVIEFNIKYSNNNNIFERALIFIKYSFLSSLVALTSNIDIVFATSTPLTASIPGIVARWLKGTLFVFEVRDLWPLLPAATGVIKNRFILYSLSLLEKVSYLSADFCIGLAPDICKGIEEKGVYKSNIKLIPNACDLSLFKPLNKKLMKSPHLIPGLKNKIKKEDFIAAFTGAHGICNGLNSLLDVAFELKKMKRNDIKIIFIGEGSCKKELQKRALREGLDNCLFLHSIPKEDLAKILSKSVHVGLMVLKNIPEFYKGTSPNKFFDYIASGIPVINNYPGWIAEMIEIYNNGYVIPPDDSMAFAKTLIKLADNPSLALQKGENSRKLAEEKFSRDKLAKEWREELEKTKKYRNKSL